MDTIDCIMFIIQSQILFRLPHRIICLFSRLSQVSWSAYSYTDMQAFRKSQRRRMNEYVHCMPCIAHAFIRACGLLHCADQVSGSEPEFGACSLRNQQLPAVTNTPFPSFTIKAAYAQNADNETLCHGHRHT